MAASPLRRSVFQGFIAAIAIVAAVSSALVWLRVDRLDSNVDTLRRSFGEYERADAGQRTDIESMLGWLPADAPAMLAAAADSVVRVETARGYGSGFVVPAANAPAGDGSFIVTNRHVVAQGGGVVHVRTADGVAAASVHAIDAHHDLAILRVDQTIAPLELALSGGEPQVGDVVFVIGNPFFLGDSVSAGIVSRLDADVVQTDASIAPGSSGGPMLDVHGRVVGVIRSGYLRAGAAFAIPIAVACEELLTCS